MQEVSDIVDHDGILTLGLVLYQEEPASPSEPYPLITSRLIYMDQVVLAKLQDQMTVIIT